MRHCPMKEKLKKFWSRITDFEISATSTLLLFIFGIAVAISFGILFLYLCKFGSWPPKLSSEITEWGAFGDFFAGLLNPIVTLLSFGALIFTILLQIQARRDEKDRDRMDTFITMLLKADEELARLFAQGAPSQKADIPDKNAATAGKYNSVEHRTLQATNLVGLMYKWLRKIAEIDSESPVLEQFGEKYGPFARNLRRRNWLDQHIEEFFTKLNVTSMNSKRDDD